ncbi:family 16 glycoside hydrolase [Thermosporothrix hazakensis]|uniref:family 16 glycoside hydrolase n=1 Tax=Thermosporothrix hazakensis TaxID=644383 RepID=UPI00147671E9|nr:family 16 glycoside hydrolase [Thermosporothrix hazakensis]
MSTSSVAPQPSSGMLQQQAASFLVTSIPAKSPQPSLPSTDTFPKLTEPSTDKHSSKSASASSRTKKRPMVVLGVVLALLVLLGGGSFAGYTYVLKPQLEEANSPFPVKPVPTPAGEPLFADAFQNNDKGWDVTSDPVHKFSASAGNGYLTLEHDDGKVMWVMVPGSKQYGDFKLFVDATLTKGASEKGGGGYGVFIRSTASPNSDLAQSYRFELYGDGTYQIFKHHTADKTGQTMTMLKGGSHGAIRPMGKMNHIVIAAKGSSMSLIVNGYTLATIDDSSYKSGSIALFVSDLPDTSSGAQAQFSNFSLFPL